MDNNIGQRYVKRNYRSRHAAKDLFYFNLVIKETDLAIAVDKQSYTDSLLSFSRQEIKKLRGALESYFDFHPEFKTSFSPLEIHPTAPPIAVIMSQAANRAGVGPMAAVAGAFAQAIGEQLKLYAQEVIIENGGDIFISSSHDRLVSVFAGSSPFSNSLGIKIRGSDKPVGICTSSGTVGPSISLGKADAVVIRSFSTALADAVATGAANRVQVADDLIKAVDYAKNISGVDGILAIKDDNLAAWGDMELISL